LLLRIDKSKKGYGLENLLEYFCSEYFKSLGYITETQIPLSHSDGVPDIGVYENFLSKEGFNLIELSMMKIFPNKIKFTKPKKELFNAYVGEAKAVSSYDIVKRLKKYMSTNFFSNSFGIYPDEKKKDLLLRNKIGIFFINKEFKFQFSEKKLVKNFNSKEIEKYADWFFNYVKFYLIANYKKENLDQFLSRRKIKKDGISKFITEVKKLSLEDLLDDYI